MANHHRARIPARSIALLGIAGFLAFVLCVPTASAAERGRPGYAQSARDDAGPTDATGASGSADTSEPSTGTPGATVESASSDRAVAEASVASLQVDRASVRAQLAEAKAARDHQFDRWALTHLAAQAAQEKVHKTSMAAVNAQQQVVVAQQRVRNYAVRAFMNPPAMESMAVLAVGDAEKASRAHDLITITADDQGRVVEQLSSAEKAADRAAALAKEAAAAAAESETASKSELESLEASVRTQQRLGAQVEQRLDSAMAEVAALREVDREAAEELEAEEQALADDSNAALGADDAENGSADSSASAGATRAPSTRPSSTAPPKVAKPKPKPTRPRPSGPPPPPPTGVVTWSDVTKVGTFWVHRSIASNVQGLLSAAGAAGFNLTGGGFRDPASQISLRQAHCGPTYYDIYQKPASQCSPPTAVPGRSMHEQGRALDIKSGGALITSRSNPAFQWLAANASRYGLYNLPSEPWHWSTNGT